VVIVPDEKETDMTRNKMIAAGLTAALLAWGGVAMATTDRPRTESVQSTTGSTVYSVEDAGTVTVAFDGTALTLVDSAAAAGWTASIDSVLASKIEVDFVSPIRHLRFNAEIEDGAVQVRVEDRTKDAVASDDSTSGDDSSGPSDTAGEDRSGSNSGSDSASDDSNDHSDDDSSDDSVSDDSDDDSDDNGGSNSDDDRNESFSNLLAGVQPIAVPGLGSVTVDVQGPNVTFVSAAGSDGWTATLDENEPGEVKVLFTKDGAQMEAKIEIEDGSLRLRVETEH
jgi:hypothetical protein